MVSLLSFTRHQTLQHQRFCSREEVEGEAQQEPCQRCSLSPLGQLSELNKTPLQLSQQRFCCSRHFAGESRYKEKQGAGARVPSGSLGKIHPRPAAEETLSVKMSTICSSGTGGKCLGATELGTWGYRPRFGGSSAERAGANRAQKPSSCLTPSPMRASSLCSVGRQKEERRIQLIRQEQSFPWRRCQSLWCNHWGYLCSARWALPRPGGAGKPSGLLNNLVLG